MKFMLGKISLASAVLATVALAATTAMAESNMKVPFNFTAAGKNWPAGTYSIQKDWHGGMVTLKSKVTADSLTFLVGPGAPDPNETNVTLKFDEVGGVHVLRSIQYGPEITAQLDKRVLRSEQMPTTGR